MSFAALPWLLPSWTPTRGGNGAAESGHRGGSFDVPPRRMVCAGVRAARARLDCGSFISPSLEHLILDHLCSRVVVCDPALSQSRILSTRCQLPRSDVSWSWLPRFEFYFSASGTAPCCLGDFIRDFWRRMFFYAYGCDRKWTKKTTCAAVPLFQACTPFRVIIIFFCGTAFSF